MSVGENSGTRLDAREETRQIVDQWVESLAQVLESMTDQRPQTGWQPATGTPSEVVGLEAEAPGEILWWEQPFRPGTDVVAWVGAPQAFWEYAGTLTLKAAGLETVEIAEARSTWFEILNQSLPAMARAIGSGMGREVNSEPGREHEPAAAAQEWARVSLRFTEGPSAPLLVTFSASLMAGLTPPAASPQGEPGTGARPAVEGSPEAASIRSRTMDLLLDVDLPVSISFGKAELLMRDVLKLTTGSIVELNRGITDPVEVLVNHCLIARGEVVVVDGNYGVRIQEIVSRQDRLRSIR